MSRRILAVISDTHSGHKLGLLNPGTTLYQADEQGNERPYSPGMTDVQDWLWECYQEDREAVRVLAAGDPLWLIHNGDLCSGLKYPDGLVSTRPSDQIIMGADILAPWFTLPNLEAVRLVYGTAAHSLGEGTDVQLVAAQLRAQHPGADIATTQHAVLTVDGLRIDYAHHGPSVGSRTWLSGNVLRLYARSLMMAEALTGRTPPRVIIRSHRHQYCHETVHMQLEDEEVTTDILSTDPYSGLTDHAVQATQSTPTLACGMVAIEVDDGRLVGIHACRHVVDTRTEEVA